MAYASNSFGGGCPPTYLVSAISSSAMSATFSDLTGWVEVDSTGAKTSQPLGTSGSFCIKLDYGLASEETVKCTSLNPSTGVITFATRGFDGTTAQAHSAGSSSKLNVFPTETATDWVNLQATATTAQSTADGKVASVTAADTTVTIAGTSTAPTVKVGTVPYAQVSGTPTALPPSGTAGGDLTGTYPNPTLAAAGTAGTYGSGSLVPVITTDSKGRVTSVTTSAPLDATKLPLAGGTMSGAIAMGASKITGLANGTASSDAAAFGQIPTALPPNGSAGGDLSGTYPNPTVVAGSTSVAGKLQLTDSTSSTSTTTAATPNSVKTAYDLANAALPKSGGTMTGRIQGLSLPGATTDPARAGDISAAIPPTVHGLKAWTYDPAPAAGATVLLASNTLYFSAIYVPYAMTVSQIWAYVNTAGTNGSSGTSLYLGIYNSTTLLASTANQNATLGFTTALGYSLSSSVSLTAGTYWIGMKFTPGTGGVAPTVQRSGQTTAALTNFNVATSNQSLINQRAATASGLTAALPSDLTALSNITFASTLLLHGLS